MDSIRTHPVGAAPEREVKSVPEPVAHIIMQILLSKFRVPTDDWVPLETTAEMRAHHNRAMGLVVLLHLPEQKAAETVEDVAGRLADALEQISLRYRAIPEFHKGPVRAFRRKQVDGKTTIEALHSSDLHASDYINNLRVVVMPPPGSAPAPNAVAKEMVVAQFRRVFGERRTREAAGALGHKDAANEVIKIEMIDEAFVRKEQHGMFPGFRGFAKASSVVARARREHPDEFADFVHSVLPRMKGSDRAARIASAERAATDAATFSVWARAHLPDNGQLFVSTGGSSFEEVLSGLSVPLRVDESPPDALAARVSAGAFARAQGIVDRIAESASPALKLGFREGQGESFEDLLAAFGPRGVRVRARGAEPGVPEREAEARADFDAACDIMAGELCALRSSLRELVGGQAQLEGGSGRAIGDLVRATVILSILGDAPTAFLARELSGAIARAAPADPERRFKHDDISELLADIVGDRYWHALRVARGKIDAELAPLFISSREASAAKLWSVMRSLAGEMERRPAVDEALSDALGDTGHGRDVESEIRALSPSPLLREFVRGPQAR